MRIKGLLLLCFALFTSRYSYCQTIPIGSCGLQYSYDASGNLISRQYVCVNAQFKKYKKQDAVEYAKSGSKELSEVDALYTEPKGGTVTIHFTSPLRNNAVFLVDAKGKALQKLMASGSLLKLDLAEVPVGRYYLRMKSGTIDINQAIVKL